MNFSKTCLRARLKPLKSIFGKFHVRRTRGFQETVINQSVSQSVHSQYLAFIRQYRLCRKLLIFYFHMKIVNTNHYYFGYYNWQFHLKSALSSFEFMERKKGCDTKSFEGVHGSHIIVCEIPFNFSITSNLLST